MKGELKMKNPSINIDLDNKILDYCRKKINEDINIEEKIYSIVEAVAKEENLVFEEISVSISSASKDDIKKINKEYRDIDKVTDVLSFPIFTKDELQDIINKEEDKKIKHIELGDIILCLEVVEEQSVEYGTGFLREILYMITHGMCHLVGYDHIDPEDKKEMRAKEEKILKRIGVER